MGTRRRCVMLAAHMCAYVLRMFGGRCVEGGAGNRRCCAQSSSSAHLPRSSTLRHANLHSFKPLFPPCRIDVFASLQLTTTWTTFLPLPSTPR